MKILIVIGSKRKGNSRFIGYSLLDEIKKKRLDIHIDILDLSQEKIKYCTGCLACDNTGKCILRDGINKYVDSIGGYDCIILISPVRWSLVSGEMKTFIDRLNPALSTHSLENRNFITIVVGQSNSKGKEALSVKQASMSFKLFCENAEINLISQYEIYDCLQAHDAEKNKNISSYIDSIITQLLALGR